MLDKFAPTSYFEMEDLLFLEKTNYDRNKKLLSRSWTFYRKQGSKDLVFIGKTEFDLHIYSLNELSSILKGAGGGYDRLWKSIKISILKFIEPCKHSCKSKQRK